MLGPPGCGKTTILRMIGGLEEATEGKVFIAGRDVTDLPPAHRDTSMMFQSFALFPHRTVFQNVEFSLKMKGMEKSARDRRVWEMLEMVGPASFASRRPRDLYGGQQQYRIRDFVLECRGGGSAEEFTPAGEPRRGLRVFGQNPDRVSPLTEAQ